MGKSILVIDDDEKLNALLKEYLANYGFEVHPETLPEKGLAHLERENPDLIILDIMLPDMDGFEVCKEIRKRTQIPIIMPIAVR